MTDPSGSGQNPFNIFGDLARLLGNSSGSLNWDVARQVTALIASNGANEGNPDPTERIRIEELVRIAQLHVEQVMGDTIVVRSVEALSHSNWAIRTLDDYAVLLTSLADSLSEAEAETDPDSLPDDLAHPGLPGLEEMQKFMTPVLLGIQVGGMLGHLAHKTLGQYDLPIPRGRSESLAFVPDNIRTFSDEWSLPIEELTMYVAVEELTRHALFQRAHVRERFTELITEYVSSFKPDNDNMLEHLSGLNMADPNDIPNALSNPESLLGAIETPEQRVIAAQLNALVAAYVGYTDWVVGQVAPKVIASGSAISEANKRRRVEESDGARLVERMFGLELSQPTFDRGAAFIAGVVERAGTDGLDRLWKSVNELPTPAEIDAPGLWLARIDIPLD